MRSTIKLDIINGGAHNGCEWIDQPPPLALCEPGQNPNVDENLIADCTALTQPMGDWLLGVTEQGREVCRWGF